MYAIEYDRAALQFEEVIRLDPANPRAYLYLATTYWMKVLVFAEHPSNHSLWTAAGYLYTSEWDSLSSRPATASLKMPLAE